MPEPTTETIESSSAVLSCDNSSQDVENPTFNAKFSDKSKLPTSPPSLSLDDSSVAISAPTESNNKSDNSSDLILKEQPCVKSNEVKMEKSVSNCESNAVMNVITDSQAENAALETAVCSLETMSQIATASTRSHNPSNEQDTVLRPNLCSFSASIPEEHHPEQSSIHPSRNITYQPSFSDLQDEYLHQICSRIGSNIKSDAFVPDIVTHNVSGDIDGSLCVIHPQTFQGADSFLTPHDKSAWSSTSSIATRPNTDNVSSMSKFTTRFGKSSDEGNRVVHETGASGVQGYIQGVDYKSNFEMENLSSTSHDASAEVCRTKKDILAFKSTAV